MFECWVQRLDRLIGMPGELTSPAAKILQFRYEGQSAAAPSAGRR